MTRLIRTLVLLFAIAASALPAGAGVSDELRLLFEAYWAAELARDPFLATSSGENAYNDRVPQISPADQEARVRELQAFMARLEDIEFDSLGDEERVSAEILHFILYHNLALAEFREWRIPFTADSGFHIRFGNVVRVTPFRNADDYRAYLKRLASLPAYFDQNVANMRIGLQHGFTQPREILPDILPSFEALVVDEVGEHPIYAPFSSMPPNIPPEIAAELREEAGSLLRQSVIPAYERVLIFMRDEYVPGARETLAASELPVGDEYYAALVRYFTTLNSATPEEIHAIGLREVARIRGEMDDVIEETGYAGTFEEFLEFLRSDPQFYAKSPDELLTRAAWISKKADGALPAFFGKLPRQPYSVEPVPKEFAPNYTGGRYISAPPGGTRAGQYWVNTYALDTRPLYQLPALTLHEAVPGHHLQVALAYEIENAPEFRQQFYPHAYGEGWGLYSEKLGIEMGLYQTPYEHFGRLSYEMWRACRLSVDTGLHSQGWTHQQANDYLAANTALSLHEVRTEVDRYIAWPGQALAYKMGELTIWELRTEAEEALGEDFDIREFHDVILARGGLPLNLLRDQVARYIEGASR